MADMMTDHLRLAGGFLFARYSARCGGLVSARSIRSLRGTPRHAAGGV
jgi:hypothetical protein